MMSTEVLNPDSATFPTLSLSKGVALVSRSPAELTTCRIAGLRRGWFSDLLLVDSSGRGWKIGGARKLHGVGPLWGYNIFLNQKIRVELVLAKGPFTVSVDDLRERVLKSFRTWHGWEEEDGFLVLKARVEKAQSVSEIIAMLERNQDRPAG
jgi:hypothetical protein